MILGTSPSLSRALLHAVICNCCFPWNSLQRRSHELVLPLDKVQATQPMIQLNRHHGERRCVYTRGSYAIPCVSLIFSTRHLSMSKVSQVSVLSLGGNYETQSENASNPTQGTRNETLVLQHCHFVHFAQCGLGINCISL